MVVNNLYCSNCGKEHKSSDKFCQFCGHLLLKVQKIKRKNKSKKIKTIKTQKESLGLLNKIKKNIKQSQENRIKKKEEKFKSGYILIEEINAEVSNFLKLYDEDVINRTSFSILLEDNVESKIAYAPEIRNKHGTATKMGATLAGGLVGLAATSGTKTIYRPYFDNTVHRKGFHGTMNFFKDFVELLPEGKGSTIHIGYHEIRKIEISPTHEFSTLENSKVCKGFVNFPLVSSLSELITMKLLLHNGEIYTIKIYIKINGYRYSSWVENRFNDKLETMYSMYKRFRSSENYDKEFNILWSNVVNSGYKMEYSLKNRLRDLFNIDIEETVSVYYDL